MPTVVAVKVGCKIDSKFQILFSFCHTQDTYIVKTSVLVLCITEWSENPVVVYIYCQVDWNVLWECLSL